jgi:hypothetical protein
MPPRPRLNPAQLKKLLTVYHKVGTDDARKLAARMGVTPNHLRKLAWKNGVRARMPEGERWRPSHAVDNDPRWEWAKQRGPVLA